MPSPFSWLILLVLTFLGGLVGHRIAMKYVERRRADRLEEMRRAVAEELERRSPSRR